MLLRPTNKELEEAKELDIDATGMNGPQIREAIKRARRPGVRVSLREDKRFAGVVFVADTLGVAINDGDGVESVKKRIEEHLVRTFTERGIQPYTRIRFTGPPHAGKEACMTNMHIWWLDGRPMVSVAIEGKAYPMVAYNVVLHVVKV